MEETEKWRKLRIEAGLGLHWLEPIAHWHLAVNFSGDVVWCCLMGMVSTGLLWLAGMILLLVPRGSRVYLGMAHAWLYISRIKGSSIRHLGVLISLMRLPWVTGRDVILWVASLARRMSLCIIGHLRIPARVHLLLLLLLLLLPLNTKVLDYIRKIVNHRL